MKHVWRIYCCGLKGPAKPGELSECREFGVDYTRAQTVRVAKQWRHWWPRHVYRIRKHRVHA